MAKHPLLLATSVAYAILSFGHTSKGLEQFRHISFTQLPLAFRTAVKAGWYEGSIFFVIAGILNYKWSQTGLVDTPDKAMAALLLTLLFGFGASYYKGGDRPTGITLAVVGILQGLGVRAAL